jgi:hypothetical protein
MGFFTPRRCDVACTCDPCICEIRLGMVPRPGSSCFVNFTTELIRRCEGAATQLDPDAYGIWLRFDSTAFGTDYFLHYEGPMADFRGIFDNFRPTINRDYVLTAYQIEGEFSDAICPDPIEEVAVSYTEERSCDICEEGTTQELCECDGGRSVPNAIVTIGGSLGTEQLLSRFDFEVCDPYPGFGVSDPDGNTFYSPLNSCPSISGTYVVPCSENTPTQDLIIFSYACNGVSGENYYYYVRIFLTHGEGSVTVQVWSGATLTSQVLPTGDLMTFQEYLDGLDDNIATPTLLNKYTRTFTKTAPVTDCEGLGIFICSLSGGEEFFGSTGPALTFYSACTLDGLTLAITR